jgi:hypothetical protein
MPRYVCGRDSSDMTQAVLAACAEDQIPVPAADPTANGTIETQPADAGEPTALPKKKEPAPPSYVRLQCKDELWCDFPCGNVPDSEVKGIPVPKTEMERWTEWQKHADPLEGLKRLDTYSTWLIGASGTVILLASGLASQTNPGTLDTSTAKWLFGLAVAALGFSWVLNSFVKAPSWGKLNRHSPDDHLSVFAGALQRRRRLFAWAASLLGLSLALASLIPLGRLKQDAPGAPRVVLTYSWATDRDYKASLAGDGLLPGTPIELAIRKDPPTGGILPVQRARTGANGTVNLEVAVPAVRNLEPPFRVVARWREVHDDSTRWVADSVAFTAAGVQQGTTPSSVPLNGNSGSNPASDSSAQDSASN